MVMLETLCFQWAKCSAFRKLRLFSIEWRTFGSQTFEDVFLFFSSTLSYSIATTTVGNWIFFCFRCMNNGQWYKKKRAFQLHNGWNMWNWNKFGPISFIHVADGARWNKKQTLFKGRNLLSLTLVHIIWSTLSCIPFFCMFADCVVLSLCKTCVRKVSHQIVIFVFIVQQSAIV